MIRRIASHESLEQKRQRAQAIIRVLRKITQKMPRPAAELIIDKFGQDPFLVLISCILSLRTKDSVSEPASCRLFAIAHTPHELLQVSLADIRHAIYPVGFYKRKAQTIHAICQVLITRYNGKVPSDEADLLALPGVGRKTMNLVRAVGFGLPAICVDTHVHRISNRLGLVVTKTTQETEFALRELLPKRYWSMYNTLMVMFGQNICVPLSPHCSICPIAQLCPRIGVTRHR